MLSEQSKKSLCNLLTGIAEGERQLELARQVLCEQRFFEPYSTFVRLDRFKNKYITTLDLSYFFKENNI